MHGIDRNTLVNVVQSKQQFLIVRSVFVFTMLA